MDITRYSELKASGNVYLQKTEGTVFIVKKNYDADTGKVRDTQILPVDKESFLKHKADAQKMIDAVTVFLDDVAALE